VLEDRNESALSVPKTLLSRKKLPEDDCSSNNIANSSSLAARRIFRHAVEDKKRNLPDGKVAKAGAIRLYVLRFSGEKTTQVSGARGMRVELFY